MEEKNEEKWLEVLKISPGKCPEVVKLEDNLEALQKEVGGLIQVIYPFEDPVGILLNEEGKLMGLEPNRALRNEDGEIYDILCGDFFVIGLEGEGFASLSEEMKEKYEKRYHVPEMIVGLGRSVFVCPFPDMEDVGKERKPKERER